MTCYYCWIAKQGSCGTGRTSSGKLAHCVHYCSNDYPHCHDYDCIPLVGVTHTLVKMLVCSDTLEMSNSSIFLVCGYITFVLLNRVPWLDKHAMIQYVAWLCTQLQCNCVLYDFTITWLLKGRYFPYAMCKSSTCANYIHTMYMYCTFCVSSTLSRLFLAHTLYYTCVRILTNKLRSCSDIDQNMCAVNGHIAWTCVQGVYNSIHTWMYTPNTPDNGRR